MQSIDLRKVVDAAVDSVRPDIQVKGLQLEISGSSNIGWVEADPDRLQQVVWNLLSNAVKFTPRGGRITLRAGIEPDGAIGLSVTDTGIGIAAADIAKAMEPFGQVDSSLTRRYQGAGLGLPISRSLIELHGGRLDLDSTPGAGTTARIRLPPERVVA